MNETTPYYLSKHALTGGIIELAVSTEGVKAAQAEQLPHTYIRDPRQNFYVGYRLDRDVFATRAAAQADAEDRRAKKIASLKKQIKKLEALTF